MHEKEDLIAEFMKRCDGSATPDYEDREARNRWAAALIKQLPGKRILNVGGGGERHLARHLGPSWQVHELDMVGDCDTKLNLDHIDRLPFDDAAFDTCCGFDVLEHLEQFHLVVDEMFRVASSAVLISLPNAAVEFPAIFRNMRYYNDPLQNGVYSKYYGLPVSPPEDRHRWWLTFEDIVRFALWFEQKHSCAIAFYIPDDEFSLKRTLFRVLAGERRYLTFCCSSVWIKITKPGATVLHPPPSG